MGVKGLWTLLEPVGKPVTLESLEGKVLAVDVSIWLHQTVHGMRDKHGDLVANAHLVGLFNRVCKLLFYKIKPIFVFDGGVPELKKQTLIARRQQRTDATERSEQATRKYLTGILKQHAIGSVLSGERSQSVPSASRARRAEKPDMYELPPLPQNESEDPFEDEIERTLDMRATFLDMISEEFQDPEDIDPDSADFQALPPELQYELLKELKEHRKQRRWQNTVDMPEDTEEFSNFQIKRMMNRSRLTQRLDGVRKTINSSASGDMVLSLTGRGPGEGVESQRLVSDESSHYILVKGLKKNSENPLKEKILADIREVVNKEDKHMDYEDVSDTAIQEAIERSYSPACNAKDTFMDHKEDSVQTKEVASSQKTPKKDLSQDEVLLSKVKATEETDDIFLIQNTACRASMKGASTSRAILSAASMSGAFSSGASSSGTSTSGASTSGICTKSSVAKTKTDQGQDAKKLQHRTSSPELLTIDDDSDGNQSDCIYIDNEHQPDSAHSLGKTDEDQIVPLCKEDPKSSNSDKTQVIDITGEGGFIHDDSSDGDDSVTFEERPKDKPDKRYEVGEQENNVINNSEPANHKDDQETNKAESNHSKSPTKKIPEQETEPANAKADKDSSALILSEEEEDTICVEPAAIDKSQSSNTTAAQSPGVKASQSVGVTLNKNQSQKSSSATRQASLTTVHSVDSGSDDEFEEVPVADPLALDISYSPLKRQKAADEQSPSTGIAATDHDTPILIDDDLETDTAQPIEMDNQVPTKPPVVRPTREEQEVLEDMQSQLEAESQTLQEERGRLDRQAATITDQMTIEAQELLRLFGLPYIVSPMEAEAQCAQLDLADMTEGTVTDDSDIWLFGGRRVFKNMFNQGKYVEYYSHHSIESQLMLDRDKLINIAFLTGSDYTPGVERVGPVTAMEVLAEFPGNGIQPLQALKSWWDGTRASRPIPGTETPVKRKLRNIRLPKSFPSEAVLKAYMRPAVDDSDERFSWGTPDLDLLRTYAAQKLGWSQTKSDELLLPVMKRHAETSMQRHITSYFGMQLGEPQRLASKRVKNVINRLQDRSRSPASASPTEMDSVPTASTSSETSTSTTSSPSKRPVASKEPSPVNKPTGVAKRGRGASAKQQGAAKNQPTKRPGAAASATGISTAKQTRRGRGGRGRGRTVPTSSKSTPGGRQTVQEVNLSESSSEDD